jgi:hypothetical protein
MSLIPSESHSFPDDFSRTISHARVKNEVQAVRASLKPQPRRPRAAAIPPAPAAPIEPPTASSAPVKEHKLSVSPRVTRPYGPVRSTKRLSARPVPALEESEATQIEMALGDEIMLASPLVKRRRRRKWGKFIATELLAIAVLAPSAAAALTHYFVSPQLIMTMNLVTIVSAIMVAIVPIIFFAIPPKLPRD